MRTPKADNLQKALWGIKEAAWKLLNEKGNNEALVATTCQQVDNKMRELGYDPTFIVKHSTRQGVVAQQL